MGNDGARPAEFENYTVNRVLGEGGMGVVFLGHGIRADLPVAIKVMSKRLHDPDLQRRFLQENEILSELNHRNIVRCFEIVRTREGFPPSSWSTWTGWISAPSRGCHIRSCSR